MENQINWKKECEKIAAELADDVVSKFVNNEEIDLNLTRSINPGDVYGLLARTPLNDEWNTVIIKYSVIPRSEIVLDKERLYKCALESALDTANLPDVMEIADFAEHRRRISESAEWEIGTELQNIFSEIAVANPDKYPVKETHGHAVPSYEERIRRYQEWEKRQNSK